MTDRLYRALLHLYPATFRERFGDEMSELFRVRRHAARRRGVVATIWFWVSVASDVLSSLWTQHRPDALAPWTLMFAGAGPDVRDAARFLRRSPGVSIAIVLLTAVTIGAASSVFSVVNAVLLRPLPFPNSERLVLVWEARPERGTYRNVVSGHEFPVWEEQTRAFARMAAMWFSGPVTLSGAGDPKSLTSVRVSAGFFEVMDVRPALGRGFAPQEDTPGRGQVVVLSERLWRERFGGDRTIVGRKILLDDKPFEVIGVMPGSFTYPTSAIGSPVDIWSPIAEPIRFYRGRHYLTVVARLKPEVTLAQAQDDMSRIAGDLRKQFPDLNHDHDAHVVPLQGDLVRDTRASLLLLMGAVFCLLLIGCSNIAGLLLARGLARQREVSIRMALGSSRLGVARQLLAESLLLSIGGAALGIAFTFWTVRAMPSLIPPDLLAIDRIDVDATVLLFALAMAVATGLLFGIAPALQIRHVQLATVLQQAGRSMLASHHPRLRRGLVMGQVALTLVLALGAGLLTRGLLALQTVDLGYSTSGVLAVDLTLPGARYANAAQQRQFFAELTTRTAAIPGVTSVALINSVPLSGRFSGSSIDVEGQTVARADERPSARYRIVSTDYFKTMRIPVLSGRVFADSDARIAVPLIRWFPQQPQPQGFDRPQSPPVAVINATMARQVWPGADPIGRRFRMILSPWITVVGVVADTRNESPGEPAKPELYLHDLQEPQSGMSVLVRTASDPFAAAPLIRSAVSDLDRNLAITSMQSLDEIAAKTYGLPRLTSSVAGTFALVALGLMLAGIYGLMAFTTAQRLPELGLRVALGADRAQVLRLVVREGLAPGLGGIVLGLLGAVALLRFVQQGVFGVPAIDPLTWITVTTIVIGSIVIACWWPARRAARVDPVIVLRGD
jgi:putative ABC transport system permease protein